MAPAGVAPGTALCPEFGRALAVAIHGTDGRTAFRSMADLVVREFQNVPEGTTHGTPQCSAWLLGGAAEHEANAGRASTGPETRSP